MEIAHFLLKFPRIGAKLVNAFKGGLQFIVTTPTTTQHNPNLNTAVGLDMTVQTPPPLTTETEHQPLGAPDERFLTSI